MNLLAVILGALGLVALVSRRSILGMLIGAQLLVLGASMMLVGSAWSTGSAESGELFALFVLLCAVGQVIIGLSLIVRIFIQGGDGSTDTVRTLKH